MTGSALRPAFLISLAVIFAAVAFQASGPSAVGAIDVDPVIWQLSTDYPETLPGDVTLPIKTVYLKTHDGSLWMSTYDDHPKAVSGPAAIHDLINIYGQQGIQVAAWFVPYGTDYGPQIEIAKQVIDAGVTALYADLEPFPGFCFLQCRELAENFWKPLRQQRPNAHLGVIYDPRPWWWEQSATAHWFSVADSALPMCYWESYSGQTPWDDPAGCVLQAYADLAILSPGHPLQYIPMLQGDSTPARFKQALDAAASVSSEKVSVWRRGVVSADVWALIGQYQEPVFVHCRQTLANDCLFRELYDSGVWLMQGGARFRFPSDDVLARMGYSLDNVQIVEQGFLDNVARLPVDGTLLVEENGADVYVVYGGTRYLMGATDYEALGLDPASLRRIPIGTMEQVGTVPPDFTQLREVSSVEQYLVLRGMRILIDQTVAAALAATGLGGASYVVSDGALLTFPEAEVERGDTDCSGLIGTVDVLQALQLSSDLPNGAICYQSADVNCDGLPATLDALLILLFVTGDSPALPDDCAPIGTMAPLH
ncbi:MAG: hypothetical protein WD904_14610 [Dehalococcoidia bacterium]